MRTEPMQPGRDRSSRSPPKEQPGAFVARRDVRDDVLALGAVESGDAYLSFRLGSDEVRVLRSPKTAPCPLGIDEGDVPVHDVLDRVHPHDVGRVLSDLAGAFTAESTFRFACRFHTDAGFAWYLVRGRVERVGGANGGDLVARAALTENGARVALEQELREADECLGLAESLARFGTWDVDLETDEADYDAGLQSLLGRGHDVTFDDFAGALHPDDRARVREAYGRMLAFGEPYRLEIRMFAQGVLRWFETRGTVERDCLGRATHVRGLAMDITEQKERGRLLELYAELVKSTPVGIAVCRLAPHGRRDLLIVVSNPAAESLLSLGNEASPGDLLFELSPPLSRSALFEHCTAVLSTGVPGACEIELSAPSGETHVLSVRVFVLPDQCVGLAFDDATDRRRALDALTKSEERFRTLAEQSKDGFWFARLDPVRFLYVNPAVERLLGLQAQDLYDDAAACVRVVHPDDREHLARNVRDAIARGRTSVTRHADEYRVVLPSGEQRWIRSRAVITPPAAGKPGLATGISEDVTWSKRADMAAALLGRLSDALSATRDYHAALERAVDLCVPGLADGVEIELLEHGSSVEWTARAGAPRDPEGGDALEVLPLAIRGVRAGSLAFWSRAPRKISDADVLLASEVGRRVAVAIENADLFRSLQDALRLRDEFLTVASHELRTPLAALSFVVQALRGTCGRSPEGARALDEADEQIIRLSRFIAELLAVSRDGGDDKP